MRVLRSYAETHPSTTAREVKISACICTLRADDSTDNKGLTQICSDAIMLNDVQQLMSRHHDVWSFLCGGECEKRRRRGACNVKCRLAGWPCHALSKGVWPGTFQALLSDRFSIFCRLAKSPHRSWSCAYTLGARMSASVCTRPFSVSAGCSSTDKKLVQNGKPDYFQLSFGDV